MHEEEFCDFHQKKKTYAILDKKLKILLYLLFDGLVDDVTPSIHERQQLEPSKNQYGSNLMSTKNLTVPELQNGSSTKILFKI